MDIRIDVEVNTEGLDLVNKRLGTLDKLVRTYAQLVVQRAVLAINTGPKTGHVYRRGAKTRTLVTGGRKASELKALGLRGKVVSETYVSEFTGRKHSGKTQFTVGWKFHRASRKGEAPATDEGGLVNSQFVAKRGLLEWVAGFSAAYAERLEVEMERPFLRPAFESIKGAFLAAVEALLTVERPNTNGTKG